MTEQVILYRKNTYGIGTWRIWCDGAHLRYAHAITEGASEVHHADLIQLNASGRNLEQQMELEMKSRISRMLDKGYKYLRDEALAGLTNQMGLHLPMLAQPLNTNGWIDISGGAFVQPKLDGHRCLITNHDGAIVAYSRKGKPITTINHILQDLTWIPEGWTIDGELYIHGVKLQTISSLIKREQPRSQELRYHWYDYMSHKPFESRIAAMWQVVDQFNMKSVDLVETTPVADMHSVFTLFRKYRAAGYEGAMLRHTLAGYESGTRSYQLLKVKERHDCEVEVQSAVPARDGSAVLRVKYVGEAGATLPRQGVEFDILAPGTVPEKQEVLVNFRQYHKRKLQIEYAMLTDDGIPFHAVATRWHEEL